MSNSLSLKPPVPKPGLTPRQVEVFRLLAQGKTDDQVGDALGIKVRTVRDHVSKMFKRMGVKCRFALAVLVVSRGLVKVTGSRRSDEVQ